MRSKSHAVIDAPSPLTLHKQLLGLLVEHKNKAFVELLGSSEFDVNTIDEEGMSLLHYAIFTNEKMIDTLFKHGATISNDSNTFLSPILLASLTGKPAIVEKLLTLYPEQQTHILEDNGALSIALRNHNRELAAKLFKFIDNVEVKLNYTSLHQAVENHEQQKVRDIIQAQSTEIDAVDAFGYTPLHLAILNNDPLMVELLVQSGANPDVRTKDGRSSHDLAYQMAKPELIHALAHPQQAIGKNELKELLQTAIENTPFDGSKINLKQLLESKGFSSTLNDIDMSPLMHMLSRVDSQAITFKNCRFHGSASYMSIAGNFDHCTFKGFKAFNTEFTPGTIIQHSTFEDSIIKNVNFTQASLHDNYFFYTAVTDSNLYSSSLNHNHFYGAQIWNVTLDNTSFNAIDLMQSDVHHISSIENEKAPTRTMPVVGILGEIYELGNFSKPGFLAAEPYNRIKQSGAIPHLISESDFSFSIDNNALTQEVDSILATLHDTCPVESIVQSILHSDLPQINQINTLAKAYAEKLDGLWIPGGPDIHPSFYGKPIPEGEFFFSYKDELIEFALLDQMRALEKPVLGVCHGAQLINVYYGGTLLQDVPGHNGVVQAVNFEQHAGSWGKAIQSDTVWGLSAHHQAIDIMADELIKVAEYGGIPKAAQGKTEPVFLSQFHPEYMLDDNNALMLKTFFGEVKERYLKQSSPSVDAPISIQEVLSDSVDVLNCPVQYEPVAQDSTLVAMCLPHQQELNQTFEHQVMA